MGRATARAIASGVRAGELSAREVAAESLAAASRRAGLGAFWEIDESQVLQSAQRVDRLVAEGREPGPLAGVPVAIKDAFGVRGMGGDAGAAERTIARRDAAAVGRLRRAGAVVLGKAAMHQLGWGTSGQTPGRPVVANPRAPGRQPGGSSSGSAVAVAAGIAPLALGVDTAGSARVPAAWCGVVGWKPRQAAVPRSGLLPLAPTFDTVGCLAGTVDDAELMSGALAPAGAQPRPALVRELTVVVDAEAFDRADEVVAEGCRAALDVLERAGATLREEAARLPSPPLGSLYSAELAEAWADELDLDGPNIGADVRGGLEAGVRVTAVNYLRARRAVSAARTAASLSGDVVATPAVPVMPAALDAPDDVRTNTRFTRTFNALDWPAIVVPCADDAGAGLQLAAPPGSEAPIWALARVAG